MKSRIIAEQQIVVGQKGLVETMSPTHAVGAFFEDDGDTGYFYALDFEHMDSPIVDSLHIYNAADMTDRGAPAKVQVAWTSDGLKALLLINRHPHAVFDFQAKRGYCRTGSPPPGGAWTQSHQWDDKVLELFE